MKEETWEGGRGGGPGTLIDEPWCVSSCCCCCGCRGGDELPRTPPRGGVWALALLVAEGTPAVAARGVGREGEDGCRDWSESCRRLSGEAGAAGPSTLDAAAATAAPAAAISTPSICSPARAPSSIRRCWDPPERSNPSREWLRRFSLLLLLGPTRVDGKEAALVDPVELYELIMHRVRWVMDGGTCCSVSQVFPTDARASQEIKDRVSQGL
jgi:hypothetical protein